MTQFSPAGLEGRLVAYVDADLIELIPDFLENRRQDVRAIMEGVEKKDFETIRVLGHDMKGSGGGYGFEAITDIGRSLEQAAKNENPTEILKQAAELATYLERVEIVFE